MKYHSKNVDSIKNLARLMILNKLYDLVEDIYETEFHGLDIRSETAQSILKKEGVAEVSNIEADLFMRNLSFEVAKLIGKLELQTGTFDTVKRTTNGAVCRTPFFGNSFTGEPS
jgi:hypothetical protein